MQELINLDEMVSYSKADTSSIDPVVASLAPIQLEKEQLQEFNGLFFSGSKRGTQYANVRDFHEIAEYFMNISLGINKAYEFMRFMLANGSRLEDMSREDVELNLQTQLSTLAEITINPKEEKEYIMNIFSSINSGDFHVIKDSERHPGGKDIIFSGVPGSSGLIKSGVNYNVPIANRIQEIIPKNAPELYEQVKLGDYSTPLSLSIMKAAKDIGKFLFGKEFTRSSAHSRSIKSFPFDKDFSKIEEILQSYLGMNLTFNFFPSVDEAWLKKTKAIFSLILVKDCPKALVPDWKQYYQAQTQNESPDKPDNSAMTEEAILCSPQISVSFSMNIKKEFVNYIAQTEDGKNVTYALHTWIQSWSKMQLRPKGGSRGGLRTRDIPRYVIPSSKVAKLGERRKEADYVVDDGRVDAARLTVAPNGSLTFIPKADELESKIAEEYENTMNATLEKQFQNNVTSTNNLTLTAEQAIAAESGTLEEEIRNQKKDLQKYNGSLLNFSWDYNTLTYVSGRTPDVQLTSDLLGSTSPSALDIADYLGFDFAEDGEKPVKKDFGDAIAMMMLQVATNDDSKYIEPDSIKFGSYPGAETKGPTRGLFSFPPFELLFQTYNYLAIRKHVPNFVQLVKQAAEELDITTLNGNEFEEGLYTGMIDDDLEAKDTSVERSGFNVRQVAFNAMQDASAGSGSRLRKHLVNEVGIDAFEVEMHDHPRYFSRGQSDLASFGNIYNYLGGMIFKLACKAISEVSAGAITAYSKKDKDGKDIELAFEEVLLPNFHQISTNVMPMAAMFGQYVPNAVEIMEQAEQQADTYKKDTSISASDIKMPGLAEGAMVFPHQLDIHSVLRNRPKHATIDVAPGGGKTITLLLDIGAIIHEVKDKQIRPLVICPDHLVPNWCEDMNKVAKGNWNVVPLTTSIWNRWGAEKLSELVENAPRNTVYVAGLNFIKLKPFSIALGTRAVIQYGTTEFLKKYNFNYICLDESHKCKNLRSGYHRAVKTITTSAGIEYIRLATGTLVHKDITDVVGQSALMSSNTFKTLGVFNYEFDSREPDSPARVRSKLSKYSAVVTKKKKEWAFMLPNPIDILVEVEMVDPNAEDMGSMLHYRTYQAILNDVISELDKQIKAAKAQAEEEEGGENEDLGIEEESELTKVNQTQLKAYLQRLEQLVIDPWGDETCVAAFEEAGIKQFVSEKCKAVYKRIDNHFTTYKADDPTIAHETHAITYWKKGSVTKELDLVEHDGILYMARKFSDQPKRLEYETTSDLPPNVDTARWKVEEHGKLLVFCRYTRSVDAIFNNLPEKYKQIARPFHGGIKDKWQNLDDFKNDPNIKILIANEQSITEGQNLQMASRIVRVDSPWTPGDYDQSTSRIFRPDPAAAQIDDEGNAGEMKREVIFIDWLMTVGTSEVAKVARLMWRTVEKVKFDEKGNKRYDPLMFTDLPPLSMSLDTLREASTVDDLVEYFQAKADLNSIESLEFSEMRKSTVATMIPLEPMENDPDFKTIDSVPIADNQRISDPYNHGYEKFLDYLVEENLHKITDPNELKERLKGLPVRTDFGSGTLLDVTLRYDKDEEGNRILARKPISSLKIRIKSDEELVTSDPKIVHVATKVSDNDLATFYKVKNTWVTETDRKKLEREAKAERERLEKEQARKDARKKREDKQVAAEKSKQEKRTKRRSNVRSGKPINEGVNRITDKAKANAPKKNKTNIISAQDAGQKDMRLKIVPSVYDGFIAVHANLRDPDASSLKEFGFKNFGEYIYIEAKFLDPLYSIFDWIEATAKRMKVKIDRRSEKRLEDIQEAFEDIKRMGFNAKLAAKVQSELPIFYRTRHQEARDKRTIKIYPIVMEDRVRLAIDLTTSPLARRWMDKTVPGARGAKWKYHEGMSIYMAGTKTEAKRILRDVAKGGYTITNMEKATEQISSLRLVRAKSK